MNVAEVSCQLWQQALHVCALAIPGDQPMNSEGMPQVMKSRLVTTSILAQHACANTQAAEDVFRPVARQRGFRAGQKERRVRLSRVLLRTPGHNSPRAPVRAGLMGTSRVL